LACVQSIRESDLMGLGTELFNITQKLQNGKHGNPEAYRLLGELAEKENRLIQLYQHAHNPLL